MKAYSIAVIFVSLFLPAGVYGLTEARPNSQSQPAQMDSNGRFPALKCAEAGFNQNQSEISAVRWYQRKNPAKLNGVALVLHGLNGRPDKMESIIAAMTAAGID